MREQMNEVLRQSFIRLFWIMYIDIFGKTIAEMLFRDIMFRHTPAAAVPFLVDRVDEITDQHIALFLQTGNRSVEALLSS